MTLPIQKNLGPHPDFPDCNVAFDSSLGFYRTIPYPSEEILERFYTQEYRAIRQESPDEEYLRFMRHRAIAQTEFIRNATSQRKLGTVIDIGCGCGELLNALQPYADRLYGFETDTVMASHANKHRVSSAIEIHNEHFFPKKHLIQSDLITMSHVLEHIPEPVDFINTLRINSISKSGLLFIEVPNVPDFWANKQINWNIKGLGHINYFTPCSLKTILCNSGFSIIDIQQCGITVKSNIRIRNPKKSFLFKLNKKLLKTFNVKTSLPAYNLQGGTNSRIYIQAIAQRMI